MGEIIQFPISTNKDLKEILYSYSDSLPVDKEQWRQVAVPAIEKLFDLPEFNHIFQLGDMGEEQAIKTKEEMTIAIQNWGKQIQQPLLSEVIRLYASIFKNS